MSDWLWHVLNAGALWSHYRQCRRTLGRKAAYHAAVYDLRIANLIKELPSRGSRGR